MERVNIIGAGLAGLSAAITLAQRGIACNLISKLPSERAQSVLAEGGINASLNTMGQNDTTELHYHDTMKGGGYLSDPEAVATLTQRAPEILSWLETIGVPFNVKDGQPVLRPFGGQSKKRTAYAKSSTGKMILNALIDEARKYENQGWIHRWMHHEFVCIHRKSDACIGVRILDTYTQKMWDFYGPVILAYGGLNGFFPLQTTGTTSNDGNAAATLFMQGVQFGNLEMIQYHPTTIGICGKRCLVSEAARAEGGRLFVRKGQEPWYFMEEKYPEFGNLMPRDVVSREMEMVVKDPACANQVYLNMTGLSDEIWEKRLPDLREEILYYLQIDPKKEPVPVEPGIHYFMGGIDTDNHHETNLRHLYACGECTCRYHGANRLGGNSMLGAILGGRIAAENIDSKAMSDKKEEEAAGPLPSYSMSLALQLGTILRSGLGILRNDVDMQKSLYQIERLEQNALTPTDKARCLFAEAMINSALARKESRGAHYRTDYPQPDDTMRKMIVMTYDGTIHMTWRPLRQRRNA